MHGACPLAFLRCLNTLELFDIQLPYSGSPVWYLLWFELRLCFLCELEADSNCHSSC